MPLHPLIFIRSKAGEFLTRSFTDTSVTFVLNAISTRRSCPPQADSDSARAMMIASEAQYRRENISNETVDLNPEQNSSSRVPSFGN
mmetsp:Transcript_17618/g.26524  ORF Transcript_17618/g.26524 Transcript_17618/m.26524 type:complete len:87 (-) Transcript_17618:561-821(-)